MKKIFILFSFVSLLFCATNVNSNLYVVNAQETKNNHLNTTIKNATRASTEIDGDKFDSSGMLYGIDAVKSDGTGYKTYSKLLSPVLNTNFIKSELTNYCYANTGVNGAGSSVGNIISTNSISEFTTKFDAQFSVETEATAQKDIFHGSISEQFKANSSIQYSNYLSSYFYTHSTISHRYSLIIQNTDDLDTFKENLNSSYVTNVTNYLNGTMSFEDFVDKYGTHIVTSADYGGFIITYYTIVSNKYNFTSDVAVQMGNSITAGISKLASASNSVEVELANSTGISLENTETYLNILAVGGNTVAVGDFSGYNSAMQTWAASTTDDNCSIIEITGLLPLWELLPDGLDTTINKNKMINDFCDYVDDNEINFDYFDTNSLRNVNSLTLTYESERRENEVEYTISDSGIQYQSYDTIDLDSSFFDIKNDLYNNGFRYADITISIDMKEKHYGYQEVLLFAGNDLYSTSDAIWYIDDYEYGGNDLKKEYSTVEFRIGMRDLFAFIADDKRKLYIRYSANGSFEDDWLNKNLKVTITFSKC